MYKWVYFFVKNPGQYLYLIFLHHSRALNCTPEKVLARNFLWAVSIIRIMHVTSGDVWEKASVFRIVVKYMPIRAICAEFPFQQISLFGLHRHLRKAYILCPHKHKQRLFSGWHFHLQICFQRFHNPFTHLSPWLVFVSLSFGRVADPPLWE